MKTLLAWFAATRFRMSVSHIPESMLIFWPVCGMFWYWFGALGAVHATLAVAAWYWSRKKLECENAAKNGLHMSDAFTWGVGWFPWQWTVYQRWDVLLPLLSSTAIAAALNHQYLTPLVGTIWKI